MNLEKLVEDLIVKMLKTILQNVLDNITIFKKDLVNITCSYTFISHVLHLLSYIFKFAFMGNFLQLYRFVPTTTTTRTTFRPT